MDGMCWEARAGQSDELSTLHTPTLSGWPRVLGRTCATFRSVDQLETRWYTSLPFHSVLFLSHPTGTSVEIPAGGNNDTRDGLDQRQGIDQNRNRPDNRSTCFIAFGNN